MEDKKDLDYATGGGDKGDKLPEDDKNKGKEEKKQKPEKKKQEGLAEEEQMKVRQAANLTPARGFLG